VTDGAADAFERGVSFAGLRQASGDLCRIRALLKEPKDKCRKPNLPDILSSRDHFPLLKLYDQKEAI
jgi:hypothetical protein